MMDHSFFRLYPHLLKSKHALILDHSLQLKERIFFPKQVCYEGNFLKKPSNRRLSFVEIK